MSPALRVVPDERPIVHHTIVFVIGPDQVAEYQAFDEAEEGPDDECFGGPRPAGGGGIGPWRRSLGFLHRLVFGFLERTSDTLPGRYRDSD